MKVSNERTSMTSRLEQTTLCYTRNVFWGVKIVREKCTLGRGLGPSPPEKF